MGMPPPTGPRALRNVRRFAGRSTGLAQLSGDMSRVPNARANGDHGETPPFRLPLCGEHTASAQGTSSLHANAITPALSAHHLDTPMVTSSEHADAAQAPRATVMTSPDLELLAQVLVNRAGDAEGAIRLINEVVRLSVMRYGQPVLRNEHIVGMLANGELEWIASSLSPELAQVLRSATKQHDPTTATSTNKRAADNVRNTRHHVAADARVMSPLIAVGDSGGDRQQPEGHKSTRRTSAQSLAGDTVTFSTPQQVAPGDAQPEVVRSGAHALGESSALRNNQAGTKRKAAEPEDIVSDYSDSDVEQEDPRRSSCGETLQIISLLAGYPVVSMDQHPDRFVEMICDRLIDRCAVYETSRKYAPANRKPPPLVYRGRDRHDRRVNWDRTDETGMRATLEAAFAKKPCCPLPLVECALRVFVRWNSTLFPELVDRKYKQIGYRGHNLYKSALDVLRIPWRYELDVPSKSEESLWSQFCVTVFVLVKARVMERCPTSALLQPSKNSNGRPRDSKRAKLSQAESTYPTYSTGMRLSLLLEEQYSFYNTLLRCITENYSSGACAETALEVEVYCLAKHAPQAFPELFDNLIQSGPMAPDIAPLGQGCEDSTKQDKARVAHDKPVVGKVAVAAKDTIVCKFFLEGRCKFGSDCKREHPGTSDQQHHTGPETRIRPASVNLDNLEGHTVLKLLCGHSLTNYKSSTARNRMLSFLHDRLKTYRQRSAALPALRLQGRTVAHYRVDFDPQARAPTNFESRLHHQLGARQRCATLEEAEMILRHLVAWNPDLFPELYGERGKVAPVSPGPFESSLVILLSGSHERLRRPLKPTHAVENSVMIFKAAKLRVSQKAPESSLLHFPKASSITTDEANNHSWLSLTAKTEVRRFNFQDTLAECFSNHPNEAGIIEEALEAAVYELALQVPKAFPEYFG
ncbi:hypothetical protein LTS10_005979 [Elasticomyces elasticus]|nr:hypothetical protein LTS10_005979 [Elasticomyces elasticus]